ncbi:MAG: flagellar hook-basal body complex protein [Aquabacterium sp.]
MAEIFSVAVSALRADQARLEQAGINASNASTPGYKRTSLVSLTFDQALSSQEASASASAPEASRSMLPAPPLLQRVTDLSAGGLTQTGRALDVAVEGKAFIALTDGTRTWLTRTASLQVNAEGELVGPRGLRVVAREGTLRPKSDQGLSIASSGQLSQGDQVLGSIQMWEPASEVMLDSADGVLFEVGDADIREADAGMNVLRSGFLEGSNVNQLKDMLTVMESVRHFESVIRLMQGYDEVLGRAIQKLGEV